VADGDRQRVGGIVRRGQRLEAEQELHHLLDLMLLRPAEPHDRALHLGWRVLENRESGFRRRQQRHAARVAEFQRASHVAGMEDVLDGHTIGPVRSHQAHETRVNQLQLVGERGAGGRGEMAAGNEVMAAGGQLDAAVAGALGAGIDPEDSHANDASISFSSMSAFDHTFLLSSCSSSASISFTICWAGLPSSFT
jgi:hypothetical protein